MRVAEELRAHEAAGSLAEELPYWGWLDGDRTCLTRSGELIAAGRLRPAAVDGRTPEQVDRVLGLWQRLLSGPAPGARLYSYLLRRPAAMAGPSEANGSDVAAISERKRRTFLGGRVQRLDAYIVWCHDPGLRPVAKGTRSGPLARLARLRKRRGKGAPTYLASEIEAAADRRTSLATGRGCSRTRGRRPGRSPGRVQCEAPAPGSAGTRFPSGRASRPEPSSGRGPGAGSESRCVGCGVLSPISGCRPRSIGRLNGIPDHATIPTTDPSGRRGEPRRRARRACPQVERCSVEGTIR